MSLEKDILENAFLYKNAMVLGGIVSSSNGSGFDQVLAAGNSEIIPFSTPENRTDKTRFFCLNYSEFFSEFKISTNKEIKPEFKSGFLLPDLIHRSNYFISEHNLILPPEKIKFSSHTTKSDYIKNVVRIKNHIQQGDIYEMNYCIQLSAENIQLNPIDIYKNLNLLTEAPFSCLMKQDDKYLICASPERFLKRDGKKIISQPIKGTIKRGRTTIEDEELKNKLKNDPKERSENVMIVDLVRNDLSKIAEKASVKVEELFEIYTFPNIHQMISTISCEASTTDFKKTLEATFPMGSMTGAPKKKAMELIEKYENFNRGLYSGTVGIINENGDFDLNVVIRSLFYDAKKRYLSICVGSAITINSDPEYEYNECMLKANSLLQAVNGYVE